MVIEEAGSLSADARAPFTDGKRETEGRLMPEKAKAQAALRRTMEKYMKAPLGCWAETCRWSGEV